MRQKIFDNGDLFLNTQKINEDYIIFTIKYPWLIRATPLIIEYRYLGKLCYVNNALGVCETTNKKQIK